MGTHTQPTPEEVGAFTVLLAGLVSAAQEMGVQKVCLHVSERRAEVIPGPVTDQELGVYQEKVELAKLGLEAQWEAVQAWLTDHMPEGTLPESYRRG